MWNRMRTRQKKKKERREAEFTVAVKRLMRQGLMIKLGDGKVRGG